MTSPTVSAESAGTDVLGKTVSDLQSDVSISGNAITGTLKYIDDYTGFSSNVSEQSGNYLALKFTNIPATATSVKVGLKPTYKSGSAVDDYSGLVEIISDPDKNGVFLVRDSATQKFIVLTTDGTNSKMDTYDLSGLVCETI